jgi:hypothetical protein
MQKTLHAQQKQHICRKTTVYLHRRKKKTLCYTSQPQFDLPINQQIKIVEELHKSNFPSTTEKCQLPETDKLQRRSNQPANQACPNAEPKVLTLLFIPSRLLTLLPPSKEESRPLDLSPSEPGKQMLAAPILESTETARDGTSR